MCSTRRTEVIQGSFGWDSRREGYYSTALIGPWGIPVLLDACPFCKELLPGAQARKRFEAKLNLIPKEPPPPDYPRLGAGDSTCYDQSDDDD
jgi:hypothetical protein